MFRHFFLDRVPVFMNFEYFLRFLSPRYYFIISIFDSLRFRNSTLRTVNHWQDWSRDLESNKQSLSFDFDAHAKKNAFGDSPNEKLLRFFVNIV